MLVSNISSASTDWDTYCSEIKTIRAWSAGFETYGVRVEPKTIQGGCVSKVGWGGIIRAWELILVECLKNEEFDVKKRIAILMLLGSLSEYSFAGSAVYSGTW